MDVVYHASRTKGLTEIRCNSSTHGESYVYAAKDVVHSALFLSCLGGDLTCQIGCEDEISTITERYPGAFKERYLGTSGSIYLLNGKDFVEGKTGWDVEVIATTNQSVLNEIVVEDVYTYLMSFKTNGQLRILEYPNRPSFIPKDDSDLIVKCVQFTKVFGSSYLKEVEKFHPTLLDKVIKELRASSMPR